MRKNKYLDELGISRTSYMGNFVKERRLIRWNERRKYGFDYRDIMNMKISSIEEEEIMDKTLQYVTRLWSVTMVYLWR